MHNDAPIPTWDDGDASQIRSSRLDGLRAYEDRAVRRVLRFLGLPGVAREIASVAEQATGAASCTFEAMDAHIRFPIKFGVGRVTAVKFLALPDLFDRWTKSPLYRGWANLAEVHGTDVPLGLIFRYSGDSQNPGPRGGEFMTLHTFDSTPLADTTRVVRPTRVGGRRVTFTLETLDSLMASFRDFDPGL